MKVTEMVTVMTVNIRTLINTDSLVSLVIILSSSATVRSMRNIIHDWPPNNFAQ